MQNPENGVRLWSSPGLFSRARARTDPFSCYTRAVDEPRNVDGRDFCGAPFGATDSSFLFLVLLISLLFIPKPAVGRSIHPFTLRAQNDFTDKDEVVIYFQLV